MQNKYPLWKYLLIILVTLVAFIYALPNIYGEDPAVQIKPLTVATAIDNTLEAQVRANLRKNNIEVKSISSTENSLLVRFPDTDNQLKGSDLLKQKYSNQYTIASNIAPATPDWLTAIGAKPMKYGLDLRGGIHFLLEVDVDSAVNRREAGILKEISQELRQERIRYASITPLKPHGIAIRFRDRTDKNRALSLIRRDQPQLTFKTEDRSTVLIAKLSPQVLNDIRQYTVEQTITTLRKRVNELGIAEPEVLQQGANRIAVNLPGIQDSARAKQILGSTATVEFRLVDTEHDAATVKRSGITPLGSQLYSYEGDPILLKSEVILSGDSITSAVAGFSEDGRPNVSISLGGGGESLFTRATRANVGKPLATVFIETKTQNRIKDGQTVRATERSERVINAARIDSTLGNRFQISGLGSVEESQKLALLLRAGALPANIYPVEERIVGPSLGKENIRRGVVSLQAGLGLILLIMIAYYRLFGFIADIALLLNLVLLVAVLSIFGMTLTLPGIAGIVLTMGMAVDANVLIYERIREEMRLGVGPQAAIYSGYERAFGTIVDANVTTLIVAVILFAIGTGPVKGFAVTLSIGLVTSMLTAITFTRALVNLIYGARQVNRLSIGTVMSSSALKPTSS